jgi:hypothetical protein
MSKVTEINNLKNLSDHENENENDSDSELELDEYDTLKKLKNIIFDFSRCKSNRIRCINLYNQQNREDMLEIVNKIAGMYIFSNSSLIETYIRDICFDSDISIELKIVLAQALNMEKTNGKISDYSFSVLNNICELFSNSLDEKIPTPIKVDTIRMLMKSNEHSSQALNYFTKITNDKNIECEFRYKTILCLEKEENDFYIFEAMYSFLRGCYNQTSFRILAAQYLLKGKKNLESVENFLISFATDEELDNNIRADASDVLLQMGSEKSMAIAREIIIILGRDNKIVRTIYDNAQNVHIKEFEQSVIDGIEFLNKFQISLEKSRDPSSSSSAAKDPSMSSSAAKDYTFENIKKSIKEIVESEKMEWSEIQKKENISAIELGLNRIQMDRALYSKYNYSLLNILLKVWTFINVDSNSEVKDEMTKRLIEELIEMSGTCSTGYAERLVNVISGFGDFNFKMGWEDQIISNFTGRLNARARNITKDWKEENKLIILINDMLNYDKETEMKVLTLFVNNKNLSYFTDTIGFKGKNMTYEDIRMKMVSDGKYPSPPEKVDVFFSIYDIDETLETFQANVFNEMSIDSDQFIDRKFFLTFFRENMLSIRDEMYLEFKDHISDEYFDLCIRKAIMSYEGRIPS